ncbi:MAG TPA: PHB depolymerase family esterase [Pirellulales bacterium]|jgi:phospholipase/carboxylesterase|nr:PHB depolymerase family esterase [Pirellulales bacterium]
MNRISPLSQGPQPKVVNCRIAEAPTNEGLADSALFVPIRGESAEGSVALFAPMHYEANYGYPLVVWLHGTGSDEQQLKRIMPLVSLRNYVALAVRGTVSMVSTAATNGTARQRGYSWSQSRAHVALAEHAVLSALEMAADRYHVAPDRVFLAGFGTGGTMALRLALTYPSRFAGVLSLEGELPKERAPLRRIADARRLPVLLASGRDSEVYPPPHVCDNLRLLHSAGMMVTLRHYPCGHELSPMMLGDTDRWMMEQIARQPAAVA